MCPRNMENADFGAQKRGAVLVWLPREPSREQSFFPDCDLVHPCHQEVTASRHRGDGQFLTRSHRTTLTESQVGSCVTRHHYTLIHFGHPTSTNYELRHPRWSL